MIMPSFQPQGPYRTQTLWTGILGSPESCPPHHSEQGLHSAPAPSWQPGGFPPLWHSPLCSFLTGGLGLLAGPRTNAVWGSGLNPGRLQCAVWVLGKSCGLSLLQDLGECLCLQECPAWSSPPRPPWETALPSPTHGCQDPVVHKEESPVIKG